MEFEKSELENEPNHRIQFRRIRLETDIEKELLRRALLSNLAHLKMLDRTGLIDKSAAAKIEASLLELSAELENGQPLIEDFDADVYEALERLLQGRIGDTGVLLRTAKSHNDQFATDLRLWIRDIALGISAKLIQLRKSFVELAERDIETVMPGYTHMQPAEAILLSHWWLANEARFSRDFSRLLDFYKRMNVLPLGANNLAGTREPIDRQMVAELLGFAGIIENSLDAVSDRDFLVEFGAFASIVGLHLSQLGSELLLWVSQEFAFAKIPQNLIIKSHSLPLKRNPEILEVLRARPSMIFGRMVEFIVELKSITTGYSLDLQECVVGLADIADTLDLLLDLAGAVLPGMDLDHQRMREMACADLVNVSNALDYLLAKGLTREIGDRIVEQLGAYCRTRNKYLSDLGLNEWQQFSPAFEADIYEHVSMEDSIGAYCSFGGSSREQVVQAISRARESLDKDLSKVQELMKKQVTSRII